MLIVLSFCQRDRAIAGKLLEWIKDGVDASKHDLLLMHPDNMDANREIGFARAAFRKVTVFPYDDPFESWTRSTWPFSANHVFRQAVFYIEHHKLSEYWLWLESDAIPTCRNAFTDLETDYSESGCNFSGVRCGHTGPHMNGVGIWKNVTRLAGDALSIPSVLDENEATDIHGAFDQSAGPQVLKSLHETKLIQFEYRKEEELFKRPPSEWLKKETVLFHTDKTGKLIDWLRKSPEKKTENFRFLGSVNPEKPHLKDGFPYTDIFIKTCMRDAPYHAQCMRSIEKFCNKHWWRKTVVIEGEHEKGYLDQQVKKLNADQYTDAEFILFTDSDTIFTRPVTPDIYMNHGKPLWFYDDFQRARELEGAGVDRWQEAMTKFIGEASPYEFMRRHPILIPRWLLSAFRSFCFQKFGKGIEIYIMEQEYFSEWNVLGFYAWTFHRPCFEWIEANKINPIVSVPEMTVRQFWSHDPIDKNMPEIERILASDGMVVPHHTNVAQISGEKIVSQIVDGKRQAMLERLAKARAARGTGPRKPKKKKRKKHARI